MRDFVSSSDYHARLGTIKGSAVPVFLTFLLVGIRNLLDNYFNETYL